VTLPKDTVMRAAFRGDSGQRVYRLKQAMKGFRTREDAHTLYLHPGPTTKGSRHQDYDGSRVQFDDVALKP
jgi:hypothetical protein